MLDIYYRLAQAADRYGLSQEVDEIDARMHRVAQVAPAGLTMPQYIQDIYRRIAALAAQIQQIQQSQSTPKASNNMAQNPFINFDTMQGQAVQMHSNNPLGLDIEK